jgi:predicted amidohydrolase YtcJ
MARGVYFVALLLIFAAACEKERASQQEVKPVADTEGKAEQVADTVYTNGKIYTVNEKQPWAKAVAIKDGKFIAVSSAGNVKAVTGKATKVIDLQGRFAMPGLHDIHLHVQNAYTADALEGQLLFIPPDIKSIDELAKVLKDYVEANPDAKILIAENLPYTLFPDNHPKKDFLDAIVDDRPFYILSETQHEGLLNSKALEVEGITADTPNPELGEILKDPETGEPTGFLKEEAVVACWKHYPIPAPEKVEQGLQALLAYGNSVGLTSVMQVHAKPDVANGVKGLEDKGKLTARFGLCWTFSDPMEPNPVEWREKNVNERGKYASDMIFVDCVKLSGDGNPGSTAAVLEPYTDGNSGVLYYKDDDLVATVRKFDDKGITIVIHAIGDAAIRQFINAVAQVKEKKGKLEARHILSHALLMHPDDIARAAELGIGVEFSPVVWYPSDLAEGQRAAVGDERMKRWAPIKSAVDAGVRIALASDGPIAWHDPLVALESAVTRRAQGGKGKPLAADQAIDVATAIEAYTLGSAYLTSQDKKVGSIEVGKYADMIVLDKNILDIPPTEIGSTRVLQTIVNGKVVFDRGSSPADEGAIERSFSVELDFGNVGAGTSHGRWHRD